MKWLKSYQDFGKILIDITCRDLTGQIAKEQAYKENYILMNILKTYKANILKKKIDALRF